jgi:hypothetical protein
MRIHSRKDTRPAGRRQGDQNSRRLAKAACRLANETRDVPSHWRLCSLVAFGTAPFSRHAPDSSRTGRIAVKATYDRTCANQPAVHWRNLPCH